MSGTASLCLQLVADRLLDAVVMNAGGRPEAALAGRHLALPRAAFLRVLRAAAPRTVARVSPERALAHIAAMARDPGLAQRVSAVLTRIGGDANDANDGADKDVARASKRLRRWLAGAHGPRELRKARSPRAAWPWRTTATS